MYGFVFAVVLLGICALGGFIAWDKWKDKRIDRARCWPTTEATIQSADIERLGAGTRAPYVPCFTFSYVVDGEYQSGRFALSAGDDRADELVKDMIGRRLSVNYDPENPSNFFIPDEIIEGCEIYQRINDGLDRPYPKF